MQAITNYLALGCNTVYYEASGIWLSLLEVIHGWAVLGEAILHYGIIWARDG